jgi:hypothetical protein
VSEWSPIETVPRDGEVVWLYTINGERLIGWYDPKDEDGEPSDWPWAFLEMEGMINGIREGDPMMWMPIEHPEPPK